MPVAVFSMEMGASQLALRMIGSVGHSTSSDCAPAGCRTTTGRACRGAQKLHDAPILIDETPALTPIDLRARARRLARKCGQLGLIIVDYLQLMSASSAGENRATEISEISRALKALAKELQCR